MVEPSFQAEMAMAMDNHDDNDSFQKIKGALFEPYDDLHVRCLLNNFLLRRYILN